MPENGPYIVTTTRPCDACEGDAVELQWDHGRVIDSVRCDAGCDEEGNVIVARVAAVTLEGDSLRPLRSALRGRGLDWLAIVREIEDLPDEGGTVGPFHGTVIKVEPAELRGTSTRATGDPNGVEYDLELGGVVVARVTRRGGINPLTAEAYPHAATIGGRVVALADTRRALKVKLLRSHAEGLCAAYNAAQEAEREPAPTVADVPPHLRGSITPERWAYMCRDDAAQEG